jgi:glycosyltransferase involved in cell wall biosynthesis
MTERRTRHILVGPLPPPYGGARVSFDRFLRHVNQRDEDLFWHFDLPKRKTLPDGTPGAVSHVRTIYLFLKSMLRIPFSDSVIVFSSPRFAFTYGVLLLCFCVVMRRRFFLRVFGGHPYDAVKRLPAALRWLLCSIMSFSERIVVETRGSRDEFPEPLRRRILVIPGYRPHISPVDQASERTAFRFLYAGWINSDKGSDKLIDAFSTVEAELPSSRLELHLFGHVAPELEEKIRSANRVIHHGVVTNDEYRKRISEYDAFVFPSNWANEGQPGALIEALMAGLPIICSDLPSLREMIEDDHNGLIVGWNDRQALVDAMRCLVCDQALRERLATAAKATGNGYDENVVLPRLVTALGI